MKPELRTAEVFGLFRMMALLLLASAGPWPCVTPGRAEVVRFEIERTEPFADGKAFGEVGPYQRIIGKVHYSIDPQRRQNRPIVDLDHAPRNAAGQVEFASDLFLLAPADLSKANGAAFYDVNNRGNKLALAFFNYATTNRNDPKAPGDAGDGFLLRHGFVVVWSGWNGELLPGGSRLRLYPPSANAAEPITGPVRCEMVPTQDVQRMDVNWANHGSYRPTKQGLQTATLTWRLRAADLRVPIPRDQFTIHVTDPPDAGPAQLPRVELEVPAGLRKGYIYELIYEAQGPLVHGVCFASVRDLIAAFKDGSGAGNPLRRNGKPIITRAHGFGVSQSGRFLRELLYWGFNEDERGRKVFDGVIPHVSGSGLGSFNHRFAQPTRHASQHDHDEYPADRFPFSYEVQTDPLSGATDGILRRCAETKTVPWVLHTQSAAEYWTRAGSLAHTDPLGQRDAQVPDSVRMYIFGGTQHGPANFPPTKGEGQNLANPGDYRPFLRALLLALDSTREYKEVGGAGPVLPPSVYPRIAEGTLVHWSASATGFPALPGVRYPEVIRQPALLDFGARWRTVGIMEVQPPRRRGDYKVLVPQCGADGNELGCLLPAEVAVPLATFTGWNLRSREAGAENELVSLVGSYIPFASRRADRQRLGDPRPSLEERYGDVAGYRKQLAKELERLQAAGYLLPEDAERILSQQTDRAKAAFAASAPKPQ